MNVQNKNELVKQKNTFKINVGIDYLKKLFNTSF